jgi:hypothetical protein
MLLFLSAPVCKCVCVLCPSPSRCSFPCNTTYALLCDVRVCTHVSSMLCDSKFVNALMCVINPPQALLGALVRKSDGYSVDQLERLYSLLSQCIYQRRRDYDKTRQLEVSATPPSIPVCRAVCLSVCRLHCLSVSPPFSSRPVLSLCISLCVPLSVFICPLSICFCFSLLTLVCFCPYFCLSVSLSIVHMSFVSDCVYPGLSYAGQMDGQGTDLAS